MSETEGVGEKVLRRIKRLLALARSGNPHEAALAAGRARDLLTEHHLSEASLNLGEDESSVTLGRIRMEGRQTAWLYMLACGVGKACYCSPLCQPSIRTLSFVGRATDVAAAKELFGWLKDRGLSFAREAPHARGAGWLSSFLQGYAEMVSYRLEESAKESEREHGESATALVRHSDAHNKAWIDKHLNTGEAKKVRAAKDPNRDGYFEGIYAGNQVALTGKQIG